MKAGAALGAVFALVGTGLFWDHFLEGGTNPWLAALGIETAGVVWGILVNRCVDRSQQMLLEGSLPRIDERTYDLITAGGTAFGLLGTVIGAGFGIPALGMAGGLFVSVLATALLGCIIPGFLAINAGADEG